MSEPPGEEADGHQRTRPIRSEKRIVCGTVLCDAATSHPFTPCVPYCLATVWRVIAPHGVLYGCCQTDSHPMRYSATWGPRQIVQVCQPSNAFLLSFACLY